MSKQVQQIYYLIAFGDIYEFVTYDEWYKAKEIREKITDVYEFELFLAMQNMPFNKQEQCTNEFLFNEV